MTQIIPPMPRYESYKDSGIDWIGDIPTHWKAKPLRALFKFRNDKNDPIKTENILSLSIAHGITPYSAEGRGGNKRKDDLTAYKLAHSGDIVLNSMNVIVGAVGMSKYFGAISPVYYALYPAYEETNANYYEKIFLNSSFQKGLLRYGKGIMMKLSGTGKLNTIRMKIPTDDLKNIVFPVPPKDEQEAIVAFLDEKTGQIDKAIEIKEKQIALLKEYKQIIIQNAVTKGLNPNAPMKNSGVDWIGDIPEHWDIILAKYALRKLERQKKRNGNTVICSNHGYSKLLGDDKQGLVSLTQHDYQGVNKGDLLIHGMDIWHGAISISEYSGDCTSVVHVCDSTHSKIYIAYFLKMLAIMNVYKLISNGVRQNTSDFRSWKKFGDIQLALPPKEEQKTIAEFLEQQDKSVNRSVELVQTQISKLKEYKASLINSAVTGKIEV